MRKAYRVMFASAVAITLGMMLPSGAGFAASSGDGSSSSSPDSSSSVTALYAKAQAKVDAKDYRGAMPILEKIIVKDSRNADALNLMGFCSRRLGNNDEALEYYKKALAINANHIGANEYLGELYLELKELPKAEEQLKILTKVCKGCEEQQELEEAIAKYKAGNS